jgi:hypothetical protein
MATSVSRAEGLTSVYTNIAVLKAEVARIFSLYSDEPDRFNRCDILALRDLKIAYDKEPSLRALHLVIAKIDWINSWDDFHTGAIGNAMCREGSKNTLDH